MGQKSANIAFDIQRFGYIEFRVTDLDRAREFYVDVIGLTQTERTPDCIYLRCIEDREHHAIVLRRASTPGVSHFGFRVSCDQDLDNIATFMQQRGCPVRWLEGSERHAQGRTLLVQDPLGFPVAFYAQMDAADWMLRKFHLHRQARPTRLDHINILVPDAQAGYRWYTEELGFRCSEYTDSEGPDARIWASWLYRKPTVHDIAVMTGAGPAVHHVGISVMEPMCVIQACDALAAAGYADNIERGPARHGISNALFVYVRDPDGNRFELYTGDYLTIDTNVEPLRWTVDNPRRQNLWGPPPPRRWFEESMSVPSIVSGEPMEKKPPLIRAVPTYVE